MRVIYKIINNDSKECLGVNWCYEYQVESLRDIFSRFNSTVEIIG